MKLLSELEKQFRSSRAHTYASENADHYRGFDAGQLRAAESLQAWLREAGKVLDRYEEDHKYLYPSQIRLHLLGATQKPKQEGEK